MQLTFPFIKEKVRETQEQENNILVRAWVEFAVDKDLDDTDAYNLAWDLTLEAFYMSCIIKKSEQSSYVEYIELEHVDLVQDDEYHNNFELSLEAHIPYDGLSEIIFDKVIVPDTIRELDYYCADDILYEWD